MGWASLDGVYYGDRPFRAIGTETYVPTIFDVLATPVVTEAELAEAVEYARRRFLAECAERATRQAIPRIAAEAA